MGRSKGKRWIGWRESAPSGPVSRTRGPRDPHPYNSEHHKVACATCGRYRREVERKVAERSREIADLRSLMGAPARY